MSNELTVKLVSMIKEHGIIDFQAAYETATSIYGLFAADTERQYAPLQRRRRTFGNKNKAAVELAKSDDWTAKIGEFFINAEKNKLTEVPMRDVINYIIDNTDRPSVTGGAYQRYIDAAKQCGWTRSYEPGRVHPRNFIKA